MRDKCKFKFVKEYNLFGVGRGGVWLCVLMEEGRGVMCRVMKWRGRGGKEGRREVGLGQKPTAS